MASSYHHGDLKNALIEAGILELQSVSYQDISLRALASKLGVTKNAPYRHFNDREHFLGALINQGFSMLYGEMKDKLHQLENSHQNPIPMMGQGYMDFAVQNKELYRLMNSPLACTLDEEQVYWPRKTMGMLAEVLSTKADEIDSNKTAAVWAYIHGLVLLRIDQLYPDHLPQPDWNTLASLDIFQSG
jgi:AcrR family transcriptional regulator